jgi:hypothetical protein
MRNTAEVTGGKPITVLLQSISGVSAINPLVAFYGIDEGKREVLFFYFVPGFICIGPENDEVIQNIRHIKIRAVLRIVLNV